MNSFETTGKYVPAESYWTTRADGAVRLHMEESGPLSLPPETVVDMFERTVRRFPDHLALAVKRGGEWKKWTYREYYQDCRTAAKALIKLGLKRFNGVGIIGFNSPEWVISDLAAIMCGGLATGIYTTNSAEACHHVALGSSANVIVVEDDVQLQKILKVWGRLPSLKAVVQYSGQPQKKRDNVYSWSEFMALGLQLPDTVLDERIRELSPNKCCTLIYTSGTTGNPKGVMISHDNMVWSSKMIAIYSEKKFGQEVAISYLALSHIASQQFDIHLSIFIGAATYFARPDTMAVYIREVRPTSFFGVPRIWEKIYERSRTFAEKTIDNPKLLSWAKNVGYNGNMNRMLRKSLPPGWEVANRLIFQKIQGALGLDRCSMGWSGAAPIAREVLDYFMSINMPILENYGMSEMTGAHTFSNAKYFRIGSVGKPLPGTRTEIANPDKDGNGEICHFGRNLFMGYLNAKEKTMEAIDDEGFIHSGDVGFIDKDGFVYINGRIKELIITGGGENVAPVRIEDIVKEEIPLLSNCILVGDRRRFLSMLLTLKVEFNEADEPTERLTDETIQMCQKLGSKAVTVQEATRDEILKQEIQSGIERYNEKAVSRPQKIQKWAILDNDFSIPGGELGPTLKLRRNVVIGKYEDLIDTFYYQESPLLKSKY